MFLKYLFPLIVIANAQTPLQNQDFLNLRNKLQDYLLKSEDERIVKFVRMSFHDLLNFDPNSHTGGPHGCLLKKPIQDFSENNGLSEEVNDLNTFVKSEFPNVSFNFGDVISLAGKVAIETAYPCLQIKWRFGRSECSSTDEKESGPPGTIDSLDEFQPFLNRYGLSAKEMAILTAGSHGLAKAAADVENSGFGTFDFASVHSGKDWIDKSFTNDWHGFNATTGKFQYETTIGNETFMRLPSDLVFFPSVVNSSNADASAQDIENSLKEYTTQHDSVFNNEFAQVYAKMLEIGVNNESLVDFVEPVNTKCSSDDHHDHNHTHTDNKIPNSSIVNQTGIYMFVVFLFSLLL